MWQWVGILYYLSLDDFATLTHMGATELQQIDVSAARGPQRVATRYATPRYLAAENTFAHSGCAGPACDSQYSWRNFAPSFDGTGVSNSCMSNYPSSIFNYHNFAQCASDSGLFTWNNNNGEARPQLFGSYTAIAHEAMIALAHD